MNYFLKLLIVFILFSVSSLAQLTLWEEEYLYTEVDIYLDENEDKYAYQVIVNFSTNVIELPVGESEGSINDISDENIKDYFTDLDSEYGPVTLEKYFPDTFWGDTVRTSRRTGESVSIIDMSQVFRIHLSEIVKISDIINDLEALENVDYAEEPFYAWALVTEPNDPWYIAGEHWNLDSIFSKYAWDYTIGSSDITISINDSPNYDGGPTTTLHEDLVGKVDYNGWGNLYGGHQTMVASIAGAFTNNEQGIASLGWNLRLRFDIIGPSGIWEATISGADVINMSWLDFYDQTTEDLINNALVQEIVCVAGAGNGNTTFWAVPFVAYPAAYNFGSDGQVIAVTATWLDFRDNYNEHWYYWYNYSPGENPILDPTQAFIDVSAPGVDVPVVSGRWSNFYHLKKGTSFSSPLVAALAGLIISIDDSLPPSYIYDIITSTADKIDPNGTYYYNYDENGWAPRLGYGRINAHDALHVASGNPHRVRDLELSVSQENHIKLEWKETYEPSLFKIYRAVTYGVIPDIEDYELIATINAWTAPPNPIPVTSWVDDQTSTLNEEHYIYYYITAVLVGNESLPSNQEWMTGSLLRKLSNGQNKRMPEESFIESVYPNPFNPSTTINYFVKENSRVILKVYDIIGKEVKTIVNKNHTSGYHSIVLNNTNLVSGVYFLFLQNGRFIDTQKVIILK